MTDPNATDPPAPPPDDPGDDSPSSAPDPPPENEKKDTRTPEQQLADYEESLKNDDWGHQPC